MSIHRNVVSLAALALAMSAAMPVAAQDTVTVIKGDHHYIYYRDHDIYFAPDTRTYYWMENGSWRSGPALPPDEQRYISSGGVDIQLDTERPYERNDYVIQHYRNADPMTQETTKTTERTVNENGDTTTTTTTTTRHRYVYYGDHQIYFEPESKTYYWMASNGKWTWGPALPAEFEPYVRGGGMVIDLDTNRPFERQDYVIARFKERHAHDRDDQ